MSRTRFGIAAVVLIVVALPVAVWLYMRDTKLYLYSAMNVAQDAHMAKSDAEYSESYREASNRLDALNHRFLTSAQRRAYTSIYQYLAAVRAVRELQTPFTYYISQLPQPYDRDEATLVCAWSMYGHVLGSWETGVLQITNGQTGEVMHQYHAKDGDCAPAIQRLREQDSKTYYQYLDRGLR